MNVNGFVRSRMRENRTYGSVRGSGSNPRSYSTIEKLQLIVGVAVGNAGDSVKVVASILKSKGKKEDKR
jgi:hypothetical protein